VRDNKLANRPTANKNYFAQSRKAARIFNKKMAFLGVFAPLRDDKDQLRVSVYLNWPTGQPAKLDNRDSLALRKSRK
jgi:hypothetical protein